MLNNRKISDLQSLKDRTDLRDIVSAAWGDGRRSGRALLYQSRWRGDDHTPSFAVYEDGYKDFGTAESGDVFHFIQREYNLTFADAVAWLHTWHGQPQHSRATKRPAPADTAFHEPPPAAWQAAARAVLSECQQVLWSAGGKWVRQYHDQRGLTADTIRHFGLGYNPDWKRIPDPHSSQPMYLPPGIVIPWMIDGILWALRVRCRVGSLAAALHIPDDRSTTGNPLPKYLNLRGSKQAGALFNADDLRPDAPTLVVEGEFDAMLAWQQLQGEWAVVTLGSASNRVSRRWFERLAQSPAIYSLLDTDAAGRQAAQKLDEVFGARHRGLILPAGKDVTEFVVAHGGDIAELVRAACPRSSAWVGTQHAAPHAAPLPENVSFQTVSKSPRHAVEGEFRGGVEETAWFPDGVPDGWRRAALSYLDTGAAVMLERLNTLLARGELDPKAITIPALLDANQAYGWNIAESTLRRGVAALVGVFLSDLQTDSSLQKEPICTFERNCVGRKSKVYSVRPIEDARTALLTYALPRILEKNHPVCGAGATLALPTEKMMADAGVHEHEAAAAAQALTGAFAPAYERQKHREQLARARAEREYQQLLRDLCRAESTLLPAESVYRNNAEFQAVFLRAIVEAAPEASRSRREMAAQVGASERGVSAVLQRAGVENVEQFAEVAVKPGGNVAQLVREAAARVKGFPLVLVISGERQQTVRYNPDTAQAVVEQAAAAGASVVVRFQVASRQRIATEEAAPLPLPKQRRAAETETRGYYVAPRIKPYFGPNYNPRWLWAQLHLALRLLGWLPGVQGYWRQEDTGEILPLDAAPVDIIACLVGRGLIIASD